MRRRRSFDSEEDGTDGPARKKSKLEPTSEKRASPPELLPEIISLIIQYFYEDDHARLWLRLVCRKWASLINYSHFSLGLVLPSEIYKIISLFGRYDKPIGLTFRKSVRLQEGSVLDALSKLTQLNQLHMAFTSFTNGELFRKLTNLESLTVSQVPLSKKSSGTEFIMTLENSTKLTQLSLNIKHTSPFDYYYRLPSSLLSLSTDTYSIPDAFLLTNLTAFSCGSGRTSNESQSILPYITNIKKLRLTGKGNADFRLFTNLEELRTNFQATELYSLKLTKLMLPHPIAKINHLTKLRHLGMHKDDPELAYEKLTNLESLMAQPTRNITVLSHLRLKTLIVSLKSANQAIYSFNVFSSLTRLNDLRIQGDISLKMTDLTALTKLSNLKTLHMYSFDLLDDIWDFSAMNQLQSLGLFLKPKKTQIFNELTNLHHLTNSEPFGFPPITTPKKIEEYSATLYEGIETCYNLTRLTFHSGAKLNPAIFTTLTALKELTLPGFPKMELPQLTFRHLTSLSVNQRIENMGVFTRLTQLQYLSIPDVPPAIMLKLNEVLPLCQIHDTVI